MEPQRLSGTGVETFEECPARYNAEIVQKIPDLDSGAAALGTVCHAALELLVQRGLHLKTVDGSKKTLLMLVDEVYYEHFADPSRLKEAKEIMTNWFNQGGIDRLNEPNRVILTTESKEYFQVKWTDDNGETKEIDCTYIFDRLDDISGGAGEEIEVTDYKSWMMPLQPGDIKNKIQCRIYALAAQIKFPNAKRIWVTLDQLRYDTVSICFTREDNIETWKYMQNVMVRIWRSDGTEEKLHQNCGWCVRRGGCESYTKHVAGGGILGRLMEPDVAIARYGEIAGLEKLIKEEKEQLKDYILEQFGENGWGKEHKTATHVVKIQSRAMRNIDGDLAKRNLRPEVVIKYGKLNVTTIDAARNAGDLTPEEEEAMDTLTTKQRGALWLNVKAITELDR